MDSLLIYGAYGDTGRLIAREAVARGGSPTVAGRDRRAVGRLADRLGVDGRAFELTDDARALAARLEGFDAVLNCAGPFVETVDPLIAACLESGTDYLDITGEVAVFERLRQRDAAARDAGITMLPGVGFDVVPSDCLAAFLHAQLPSADELALGIKGSGSLSRGTARTLVDQLGSGGVVRRNGRLVKVPTAFRSREIDFGAGPEHAVAIPWGDVVTAAHTTGVGTIEVYAAAPPWADRVLSAVDSLGWLLERRPVERGLKRLVDARVTGPDAHDRSRNGDPADGRAVVWGEVTDEAGRRARARIETPDPYALTAESAVIAAQRVLADRGREGRLPDGFQTPAAAFGADFALELTGVERDLLEAPADPAVADGSGSADSADGTGGTNRANEPDGSRESPLESGD